MPIHYNISRAAAKLKECRVATGKQPEDLAMKLGLSLPAYYDLEDFDDLFTCASVKEICVVCSELGITAQALFSTYDKCTTHILSPADFISELKDAISREQLDLPEFEEIVGWSLGESFYTPEKMLSWSVEQLADICAELNLDWVEVLEGLCNSSSLIKSAPPE